MAAKLAGAVALVAGGAGTVGYEIVKGFLKSGSKVVVPSRSTERLASLTEKLGKSANLFTVQADITTEEGMSNTLKFIDDKLGGQLDHVVSALGGGVWNTPVLGEKPVSFFMETVFDHAAAHYGVANATLKRIADKEGASYLFITGGLGGAFAPGAGFTTIGGAALWGLSIAVRGETKQKPVRVNELRIFIMVPKDSSLSQGIGELAATIAGGSTKDTVISLYSEDDLPALKETYG